MSVTRALLRNPAALAGLLIVITVIFAALLAPWITPHGLDDADISQRLQPPNTTRESGEYFLLGTDQQGRDLLTRLIYGSRVSLMVGFMAVVISGTLGSLLGLIAGYFGGRADTVIMRLADVQLALPFILLAIAVIAVLGPGLWNVIAVLGVTGWVTYARLVRAECLALREKEFVEAARALGAPHITIMLRHILPNLAPTLIVWATLRLGAMIVLESTLTFLGMGVEATIPTWGRMLADGRDYIQSHWWLTTFPGLAIMMTVLGINLLGDWIRDYLDPRLKNMG